MEDNNKVDEEIKEKKSKKGTLIKELVVYVLIFLLFWKVIPHYVIERTVVDGTSMLNTLQDDDQLLVEKVSYQFGDPKRYDIVILMPYGDLGSMYGSLYNDRILLLSRALLSAGCSFACSPLKVALWLVSRLVFSSGGWY